MSCKEEICAVFRDLRSAERIDLLCTMLQLCFPLELRFVGSCLEDTARKDYSSLLEYELRANDPSSLNNLKDPNLNIQGECKIPSTLNVYLSLMHSDNTACAHILFGILTKLADTVEAYVNTKFSVRSSTDDFSYASAPCSSDFVADLTLLFTLACYHPAFTFSQRQQLYSMCKTVEKLLNSWSPFMVNRCLGLMSGSPAASSVIEYEVQGGGERTRCSSRSRTSSTVDSVSLSEPFVKSVRIQHCDISVSPKVHEYQLEVMWSDGSSSEIVKSYNELLSFHTELLRLFPKDAGAHKQERSIPFLPQDHSSALGSQKMSDLMSDYFRKLPCAPDHIVQCEQMTSFFRCLASSPSTSNVSVFTLSHPSLSASVSPTASSVSFQDSSLCNQTLPAVAQLSQLPTESSTCISISCANNVLPAAAVPLTARSADANNLYIASSCSETALLNAQHTVRKIVPAQMSPSLPDVTSKPVRPWLKNSSSIHAIQNGLRPPGKCFLVSSVSPGASPVLCDSSRLSSTSQMIMTQPVQVQGVSTNSCNELAVAEVGDDNITEVDSRINQHNVAVYPATVPVDASVPNGFLSTGAINMQNAVNAQANIFTEGNMMSESYVNPGDLLVYPRYVLGDDRGISFGRSPIDFSQDRLPAADHQTMTAEENFKLQTLRSAEMEVPANSVLRLMPLLPQQSPLSVPSTCDLQPSYLPVGIRDNNNDSRRMCMDARESSPACTIVSTASPVIHRVARPILGSSANLSATAHGGADKSSNHQPSSSLHWDQANLLPGPKPLPSETSALLSSIHMLNGNSPAAQVPAAILLPNGVDVLHSSVIPDADVNGHRPPSAGGTTVSWPSGEMPTLPITCQYVSQAPDVPVTLATALPVLSGSESSSPSPTLCANGCCQCGQCQLPTVPQALPIGNYTTYNYSPVMFQSAPPYFPGFSYIPSLSFPPPPLGQGPFSGGYSQPTDLVYASHPMFAFVHHQQRPVLQQLQRPHTSLLPPPPRGLTIPPPLPAGPLLAVPFNPMMPPPGHSSNLGSSSNSSKRNHVGGKNLSCYNCGNIGHVANWCQEPKIQASTAHLGKFRLNCLPKALKADDSSRSATP